MVWVVTEAYFGGEITEVVGVAHSREAGQALAEKHWQQDAEALGPLGDGSPLVWLEDGRCYYMLHGRRFMDPYEIEEFPVQ